MFLRKAPKVDINRFTDHLGISFELCTCEKSRGASYWKLNDYSRKLFVRTSSFRIQRNSKVVITYL